MVCTGTCYIDSTDCLARCDIEVSVCTSMSRWSWRFPGEFLKVLSMNKYGRGYTVVRVSPCTSFKWFSPWKAGHLSIAWQLTIFVDEHRKCCFHWFSTLVLVQSWWELPELVNSHSNFTCTYSVHTMMSGDRNCIYYAMGKVRYILYFIQCTIAK